MNDLKNYINRRKVQDREFSEGLDSGYQTFKIGTILRQTRENLGLTQEDVAARLYTKKSAISRMENHAEDMSLTTLGRLAATLGKKIEISII
ncbi:MAG: helix-turn-helix transcriptional regulator [Thiomargarita sp.]|nr:helix-turn-helix transcriptional regulator [Thiomargarita sp.]